MTLAVPPHHTSQNCSNCDVLSLPKVGQKVQKSLATRTDVCHHCGFIEDRDINASINILTLGLSTAGHTVNYATGDLPSWAIGVNLSSNGESGRIPASLDRGVSIPNHNLAFHPCFCMSRYDTS